MVDDRRCSVDRRWRARAACTALVVLVSAPAWAGVFTVSPVRIFMSPRDRAIAVTVTNDGDEELVMQAEVFKWDQKPGGEDELVASDDLVLSPPILKLAPKARQVVRLALINRTALDRQVTYRLVVREVPEVKQATNIQMQVALAFSMPVFITPQGAKRNLGCTASRATADVARISCENTGNAYAQIREFSLTSATGDRTSGGSAGGYILPGVKRAFDIRRAAGPFVAGKYTLGVILDDGTAQSYDLMLPE